MNEAEKTNHIELITYVTRFLAERHMRFHFYTEAGDAYDKVMKGLGNLGYVPEGWNRLSLALFEADMGDFETAFNLVNGARNNWRPAVLMKEAVISYIFQTSEITKRL